MTNLNLFFKKISKFNRVILTMVIVDFFMNGAFSTIAPFFAIFITENIVGGSAKVAGFAASIYWLSKSIFQLPISRWLDRTDGELDEFWSLILAYFSIGFIPVLYFFSTQPWHIYTIQALFGFFSAWATPAWYSLFTRHLDKFRIGFEWSLFSVFSVGVATTIAAAGAGILIEQIGFRIVFLLASGIIFLSALSLYSIKKYVTSAKEKMEKVMPEHKPKQTTQLQ